MAFRDPEGGGGEVTPSSALGVRLHVGIAQAQLTRVQGPHQEEYGGAGKRLSSRKGHETWGGFEPLAFEMLHVTDDWGVVFDLSIFDFAF